MVGGQSWRKLLLVTPVVMLLLFCCCPVLCTLEYPRLHDAMRGFDPHLTNAFERFDLGFKNQIFEPFVRDPNRATKINPFVNVFQSYESCDLQFTTTVLKNFMQYKNERVMYYKVPENSPEKYREEILDVGESDMPTFVVDDNVQESNIYKFFRETDGEIIQTKVKCITQEVSISSISGAMFTTSFLAALNLLYRTINDPYSSKGYKIYRKFIKSFGTHFLRKTKMGAELIFQKFVTKKETNEVSDIYRRNCIANAARTSVSEHARSPGSISRAFSAASKACEYFAQDKQFFENNNIDSERVVLIGASSEGSLDDWSAAIRQSPVPIRFELEKISSLFLEDWFNKNVNGTALYNLFENKSATYCRSMYGRTCARVTLGCGVNSECPAETTCVDDSDALSGYRCSSSLTNYGGVIFTGGYSSTKRLAEVEAINTWTPPDLPVAISSHTTSQVGSKLYNCGGTTGENQKMCYMFDLSRSSAPWTEHVELPVAMADHTAVTVGTHIWLTYENKLYDLDTIGNDLRTYHLPMKVAKNHCAVSNSTHSYIIGAIKKEIWVNKYPSNPLEWELVGQINVPRVRHGCLWINNNIIIAGGFERNQYIGSVEIINTETNVVTESGNLLVPRRDPAMFILDGEVAVAGGRSENGVLDTIETLDPSSSRWKRSRRKLENAREYFDSVQVRESYRSMRLTQFPSY